MKSRIYEFSVWAPYAETVKLHINDLQLPMRKAPDDWFAGESATTGEDRSPEGWFCASIESHQTHLDYAFAINGQPPVPDPRSGHQPAGVDHWSRSVNHEEYPWQDQLWNAPPLSCALIYELHVGTFTPEGTFEAIIDKLDYLLSIGVTHIELMPVAEFHGAYGWGYDGVDIFAPHHPYGGPDGLKKLVNACHLKGISVIIDVVYNHFGPIGCYAAMFGPYFTEATNTYWGQAINFGGPHSDEVRRFFIDNAIMWLRDYHCDGLRIDAIQAIVDNSALHFLEQLATEVDELEASLGRHFVLIAESDLNDPRVVQSKEIGGFGLDAHWNDDFHHSLHALLTGQRNGYYAGFGSIELLARSITQAYVYAGTFNPHRSRRHGRPATGLRGSSFIAYMQNHDQIGNQANGYRSSHILTQDQLKVAAGLVLMSPFVPMVFQGEEWGASTPFPYFLDCENAELAEAVRKGRVKECVGYGLAPEDVPDPIARETFERARLDWNETDDATHAQLLEWHRTLIHIRRTNSVFGDGRLDRIGTAFDETGRWLVINRRPIVIAVNLSDKCKRLPMEDGAYELLAASKQGVEIETNGVKLPDTSIAILIKKRASIQPATIE